MKKVIITVLLVLIVLTIGGIIYVDRTNDARKQEYEQNQSTEERFDFSKLEDYMNSTTEENKSDKTSEKKKKKSNKKKNTDTKEKASDKKEDTVTVADKNKKTPSTSPSSNKTPSTTKPSSQA